jgi:hypothetical protein
MSKSRMTNDPGKRERHPDQSLVTQVSNLLYRGFPIRQRQEVRTASRLEVGDTEGWKPALRFRD